MEVKTIFTSETKRSKFRS